MTKIKVFASVLISIIYITAKAQNVDVVGMAISGNEVEARLMAGMALHGVPLDHFAVVKFNHHGRGTRRMLDNVSFPGSFAGITLYNVSRS